MNLDDDDTVDELPARPRKIIPAADRELLELAARALGAQFEEVDGEGYGNLFFEDGSVVYSWNSLMFSGDAFELGVELGIQTTPGTYLDQTATAYTPYGVEAKEPVSYAQDMVSATRRAITRAAAELGRAILQQNS